jgi:hypothetical protein
MTTSPEDRSKNSNRSPEDFLAEHGLGPIEQHAATMHAAAEASAPENMVGYYPTYKVKNSFLNVPCRDCAGTLSEHSDTCYKRSK